jgi:hypothetical protein
MLAALTATGRWRSRRPGRRRLLWSAAAADARGCCYAIRAMRLCCASGKNAEPRRVWGSFLGGWAELCLRLMGYGQFALLKPVAV